jgi:hypothetical protein
MALNDDLVRVGVTGSVYRAPVGTALPTDTTTALNAAFEEVGLITPDALTESLEVTKEILRAWQRPTGVRTITTEVNWTFQFQAMETSPIVLELYYGGAETTVAGAVATTEIPTTPVNTEKAWVIQIEDGDIITRYVIPKGDVTERGEVPHRGTEGTVWDITVAVLGTTLDVLGYRITDDPEFVDVAS